MVFFEQTGNAFQNQIIVQIAYIYYKHTKKLKKISFNVTKRTKTMLFLLTIHLSNNIIKT